MPKISDHFQELMKIKTIKGQVEGIEKMIVEKRQCVEILGQIRAVSAGLVAVEASILETHLKDGVTEALKAGSEILATKKIEEMMTLFKRSSSKGVRL